MISIRRFKAVAVAAALVAVTAASTTSASAQLFFGQQWGYNNQGRLQVPFDASHARRQVVAYRTNEAPGTIIVDTPNTFLYLVQPGGKALRYGIGVGREGFTWSGVKTIERKAENPDWVPPAEMIARQPYLPRFVAGGPTNPLGTRALYLSGSVYRIHGTNAPETIGARMSSGCIRMLNEDVEDLYNRVQVGTKVVVLPAAGDHQASNERPIRSERRAGTALNGIY